VRLFVALNFPGELRDALWRAAAPLRDLDLPVKWVGPDGIHLTLKFLGEVPDEREGEIRAALARAAGDVAGAPRPLTIDVRGFGAFPSPARPRVFWAGIEPTPALELLQHRVERELGPLGFPTEARAFRPHVTLGRAARDARPAAFARAGAALAALSHEGSAVVDTVDLMQSTLRPGGAAYQVRHRERLS
jgi:2'-5' RNA ligase